MEGVAALSLACNIVQVVEYGAKAVAIIAEVYRDGKSTDNAAVESTAERLRDLCRAIDFQAQSTILEARLQQTVQRSTATAAEITRELSKLKGNGSAWTKLKAGMVSVKRKGYVEKLRQRLADCERAINTGILATLREQDQASRVMQTKAFGDLDSTLQRFIARLAQGQAQIADLIKAESETTRLLIEQSRDAVNAKLEAAEASERRARILKSLRYPDMNARRNRVEDASAGTFDPLLDPSDENVLLNWFCRGSGVLWIQGKAGSGKSTLMKFITQSTRLTDQIGQHRSKFVMLSHFFWLSGSSSQRDLHGLLCSLAYQLVGLSDQPPYGDETHTTDWSTRELGTLISSSLNSLSTKTTIFILLDALDSC